MPATDRRHAPAAFLVRYRTALQLPGALALVASSLPIRLGSAMLNLAILLLVHARTGSYTTAGAATGLFALAGVLGGPLGARLTDRYGQRRALPPLLLCHAAGMLVILAVSLLHGPVWLLYPAAVPAGACLPPAGALTRARWGALTGNANTLSTAYAFETLLDDLTYVIGPALATLLGTLAGPVVGPASALVLVLSGGLSLSALRSPGTAHLARSGGGLLGPLRAPGVRVLAVAFIGIGFVFSGLSVSLTAFATARGEPAAAGPLYSCFCVASMVAGAAYGAVHWRTGPVRRLFLGFAVLTAGSLALPVVPGLGLMAVAVAVPGLALAPTLISGNALVQQLAPAGTAAEAFAWLGGAAGLGVAVGSTLSGRLIDGAGPHLGFVVPALGAGAAALVVAAGRRRLSATADPQQRQLAGSPAAGPR